VNEKGCVAQSAPCARVNIRSLHESRAGNHAGDYAGEGAFDMTPPFGSALGAKFPAEVPHKVRGGARAGAGAGERGGHGGACCCVYYSRRKLNPKCILRKLQAENSSWKFKLKSQAENSPPSPLFGYVTTPGLTTITLGGGTRWTTRASRTGHG
jgi:hypothetical protein